MKSLPLNPLTRFGRFVYSTHLDRVWLAIATFLLGIALLDATQLAKTFQFVAAAAGNTFGFLFLSVGLTAYAKASGVDNLISHAFSGPPFAVSHSTGTPGAISAWRPNQKPGWLWK